MRWLLVVVVAILLVGCGDDDEPSEEESAIREATQRLLAHVESDRYADAWETLHPEHQSVITREQLVRCGEQFPVNWRSFEVGDIESREWTQEEVGVVNAWVVETTFRADEEYQQRTGTQGVVTRPFQWTEVDGEWRWFVRSGELSTFRDGGCGVPWAVFAEGG